MVFVAATFLSHITYCQTLHTHSRDPLHAHIVVPAPSYTYNLYVVPHSTSLGPSLYDLRCGPVYANPLRVTHCPLVLLALLALYTYTLTVLNLLIRPTLVRPSYAFPHLLSLIYVYIYLYELRIVVVYDLRKMDRGTLTATLIVHPIVPIYVYVERIHSRVCLVSDRWSPQTNARHQPLGFRVLFTYKYMYIYTYT